ncbi:hypothetical protein CsatB_015466 [Cannabis sativa]
MSNSIGHNLVNQSLVQSKLNSSGIPANTLFQTPSFNQVATRPRKSQSSKDFSGSSLVIRKSKLAMGSRRSTVPRAVLATVQTSELLNGKGWQRGSYHNSTKILLILCMMEKPCTMNWKLLKE